MASGGDNTDPETKEAYYLRLHFLLVKEGTAILKAILDYHVPPRQLQTVLLRHKNIIDEAKKGKIIVRADYNRLYPQSKLNQPRSETFDISLLFFLLQTICPLDATSQWWREKDNNNIKDSVVDEEADITRIKNIRNQLHHKNVASLEKEEFESLWDLLEKVMLRIAVKYKIKGQQRKIDEAKMSKLDLVTQAMRSLRDNTELFLEDYEDSTQYVETNAYNKAKDILKKKRIVVLIGHPGEGKTAMAARLALFTSQPRNSAKLSIATDWRTLDLSLKLFDTVIIDDIFGSGALDQRLVREWKQYLPEIERASRKRHLHVIITSRHYIFEESKEEMSSLPDMFKDENGLVLLLTSSDLSLEERHAILNILATKNEKDLSDDKINFCIQASRGRSQDGVDFVFGFPECASMFVRNDEIFKTGSAFFEKPAWLFKRYLAELYKGENKDKFMALVAVWAKENKRLSKDEVRNISRVSDPIKRMISVFGLELNQKFLELMNLSLDSHKGGFLVFSEKADEYTFSHNVIGDMVGIVVGKKKPEETVEICSRDFLMERVSIYESSQDEFKVIIKERKFYCLAEKCTNMILRRDCNKHTEDPDIAEFQMLRRRGQRGNVVRVASKIDFSIIKHKAFSSVKFVTEFIKNVVKRRLVHEVFAVPVMTMKGYFLDYGISMNRLDMCLMGYAWYSGAHVFAKEIIKGNIMEMENFDPSVSMLLAAHSKQKQSVEFLLENGANVTGDVIYIAAHKSVELLDMLLRYPGVDVNDRGNAINGNYPLIDAARKGLKQAVACMLKFGANTAVQNTAKMTALHKAILYKHSEITTSLIEAGAPLDVKGGKYKRTPLHLAVDLGNKDLVNELVKKGASLRIKDYQGQFPIHIAAIRGNIEIVKLLFTADRTQETLRISSYGTKSIIKGMSLYHVAIWKKNARLLAALIKMEANPNIQDFYGQTPLFYAIMKGHVKLVERLLNYTRTDKRKPQKQGYTPLHAAVHKDLTEAATKLIDHSDINALDRYGKTPLHVACEKVNITLIKKLLASGADSRIITKRGDTVFHLLKRKKNRLSIKLIEKSRRAEILLANWDPEFVQRLPSLKNKTGAIIKLHYRPTGMISRKQLLLCSPKSSRKTSEASSADNRYNSEGKNSENISVDSDDMDYTDSNDAHSNASDSDDDADVDDNDCYDDGGDDDEDDEFNNSDAIDETDEYRSDTDNCDTDCEETYLGTDNESDDDDDSDF